VCDEDVIKVYHDVSRQDEVLEDVVHHHLEGCRGVGQAEVHHQGFKKALVRPESSLPLVTPRFWGALSGFCGFFFLVTVHHFLLLVQLFSILLCIQALYVNLTLVYNGAWPS
jgi:hypothetical protein